MRLSHLARPTALAICVAVGFALPAVSQAASADGFSARPAHFDPKVPSTRSYFQLTVGAGQRVSDAVIITNASPRSLTLHADPVEGLTGTTSGAVFANRQDPRRGAATWVTADAATVRVPAHRSVRVGFTVQVPSTASVGDHLAGLALQNIHPRHVGGGVAITEVIRTVIGIQVRVPGRAAPAVALRGVALAPLAGTKVAAATVRLGDVGRLLCRPRLAVTLRGPDGVRRVVRQLSTTLPGDMISYPLAWPKALPAGRYVAKVRATRCGRTAILRSSVRLGSTLRGTTQAAVGAPAPGGGGGVPWWAIVVVGVGGVALGVAFARRRDPQPEADAG